MNSAKRRPRGKRTALCRRGPVRCWPNLSLLCSADTIEPGQCTQVSDASPDIEFVGSRSAQSHKRKSNLPYPRSDIPRGAVVARLSHHVGYGPGAEVPTCPAPCLLVLEA